MTYAVVFCLAFTAAVLSAPLVRLLAVRVGAVDRPDGKRKIHTKPTPRLGGVVISLALGAGLLLHFLLAPGSAGEVFRSDVQIAGFALGFAIILGLGIVDDISGVRPRTKIVFQTLAVIAVWAAGFRVDVPFFARGEAAWVSLPVTWFWLVACVNAMNLVDGMDGLASGVAFFVVLVIFAMAALYSKVAVALMAAALLGSVVGFLLYNFHPAVMFLGDSGSMLLGYLIATLAIAGSLRSHATLALLIPILALGLPIMDTLLAILRRWSRRLPISQADREHVHHKLLAMGFSHREAVVVLYGSCLTLAAGALVVASASSLVVGIVLGVILVAGVAAVRLIGASEIGAFLSRLGETLRAGGQVRRAAAAQNAAFWLRQSRNWDDVRKGLDIYVTSQGLTGATLCAGSATGSMLAQVGQSGSDAGTELSHEETLLLPSGKTAVLVMRGYVAAALTLPDEMRGALLSALVAIEQQGRSPEAAQERKRGLQEGFAAS